MSTFARPSVRSSFTAPDVGLFLLLAGMWGLSFLFIKVAVAAFSPLWVVGLRTSVGAVVLLTILRARGRRLPPGGPLWGHLLVLAALGNAVPWGAIAWAQQAIPSGLAAVVNSLVPASTLIVAAATGVERLTLRRGAGLLVAFGGTAVVVSGEVGAPQRLASVVVVAAATVMYGAASVYAKRFVSGHVPALSIATGQVALAAALSLPTAAAVGPTPAWGELSARVVGAVGALGALGTGLAFLLFYLLIDRVGPTNTTMVTYLMPVIGVIAGWLVLDERFGPHVLVGGVVIVAGIWLAQRERQPAPV